VSKSQRLSRYCFFLAALCLTGVGSAASARIDETRIGIVEPIDGPSGDKFGAPDINVEVLPEQRLELLSATPARYRHHDQYGWRYQRVLRGAYLGRVSHQETFPGGLGRGSAAHGRRLCLEDGPGFAALLDRIESNGAGWKMPMTSIELYSSHPSSWAFWFAKVQARTRKSKGPNSFLALSSTLPR
jgi:hypothetical protein